MSEFKDLYKAGIIELKEQQTIRREKLLDEQRKKREANFSGNRDIKSPHINKWKKHREFDYKHNLMLSEFMTGMPDDLENFLLKSCPKGIRCTISNEKSRHNLSKLYYKNGTEFLIIKTNLPKSTVLDCIFSSDKYLFILDVIKYEGRDFTECDTSFRNFWIKNKFFEDDLKVYEYKENKTIQLRLIEAHDFVDSHIIQNTFSTFPIFEDVELDGFLFYHKEGFYTAGETPLVLWLFGFMIEDVLPMFKVNPYYNDQRPENYTNYLDYIDDFNRKLQLRSKKRRSRKGDENMEIQEFEESDEMQKMIDLEKYGDFE